jgi:hypothetical protein
MTTIDTEREIVAGPASGLPWYILSAKFGLLAPNDVIGPYDVYLADQSPGYKNRSEIYHRPQS